MPTARIPEDLISVLVCQDSLVAGKLAQTLTSALRLPLFVTSMQTARIPEDLTYVLASQDSPVTGKLAQLHSELSLQTSVQVEDWVQHHLAVTTVVRIMTVK